MSRCRSCSAEIAWCFTDGSKRMPVDVEPTVNGNITVLTVGGILREGSHITVDDGPSLLDSPGLLRYTPHFATCDSPNEWRRE